MEETHSQSKLETIFISLGITGVILVIVVAVCGCPIWSLWSSLDNRLCGNEIFQEIYSPDRQYKVVVFERSCGATTNFSSQISILKSTQELPNEGGNIFVMAGHPDDTKVQVVWENNQIIVIAYANGYKVSYHQEAYEDFRIRYKDSSNK